MIKISLFEEKKEVQLQKGLYNLYFLGGFKVSIPRDGMVVVKNKMTKTTINLKSVTRFKSYEAGKKAVKLFEFEVNEAGIYSVQIINLNLIEVKSSMLFSLNFIQENLLKNKIDIRECEILIVKR